MIAGLCESPLTFQAVTIWRNELNDGNVFVGFVDRRSKPAPDKPLYHCPVAWRNPRRNRG
jgi:hypothetical protein